MQFDDFSDEGFNASRELFKNRGEKAFAAGANGLTARATRANCTGNERNVAGIIIFKPNTFAGRMRWNY